MIEKVNFEAVNDEDVINKADLDENLLKVNGHLSSLEKEYTNLNYLTTNNP